jgi:NhaP-type Na+/H+ or K+/H+ antiporter
MDIIAVLTILVFAFWAGRIAERRGRSFKTWAYLGALLLGPLAIPLLYLFPNLQRRKADPA